MGRHMTKAIVAEAKVELGVYALDVACGTGEPAISIALLLNGTGLVFGVDISPEPLKIAQQRARERSLVNVRFQQADVHSLPFAGASFDRVTCRLGIMFFSDLARALGEIHRVLKPGGAAGFCSIEEEFRVLPWSWPGTPEEVWDYFQEVTVPFRPLLEAIPSEQRGKVNSEVLRAITPYYDGVQVNFTATVCLASAHAGNS
jgi:ubiquinone/menaquinone biosynthesis C-methylase UbiE